MGVDYYTCANCADTFPDYGPYGRCEKEHHLCDFCSQKLPKIDDERDEDRDGCIAESACPVCQKGGTQGEQLKILRTAVLRATNYVWCHENPKALEAMSKLKALL